MNSCDVGVYVLGFLLPVFISILVAIVSGSFGELREQDWVDCRKDWRVDSKW